MEYHAKLMPKTKGLLEIYDQMGNLVKSFVLYPEVRQLKIDLSNFATGIYPYRIILDNTNYGYDKIVLQK